MFPFPPPELHPPAAFRSFSHVRICAILFKQKGDDLVIQPEYDLLQKIKTNPIYTDDDFSSDERLYLKNCELDHWVHCRDQTSFTWAITSRGEAAMKRFEYEQQQQAEANARAKRKDKRDFCLQLLAVFFAALSVFVSLILFFIGKP